MIKEAEARMNYLLSDEETRRLYAIREKASHDRASLLYDARQDGLNEGMKIGIAKGLARGLEQGIEQGMEQAAIKMLEKGFEADAVCEITGLAADQVERLRRKG